MKILISDKIDPQGLAILTAEKKFEVINKPGLKPAELLEAIAQVDALIIRSASQVTDAVFAAAQNLKIVGRAGIGVDNIDCPAATKKGVIVENTPSGNATTTAEHTIAMMLSLSRYIPQAHQSLSQGAWEKSKFTGSEIAGKTLGVIGFGNIGKIVCQLARGLQMKVIVADPFLTAEIAVKHQVTMVTLDDLCQRADFITVHVPLNDSTQNLLNRKNMEKMKKGVRLVNCARGGIINEADLLSALESGKVAGAALDVFVEEPPKKDNPLLNHPKIVVTPHLGASTEEAQLNVSIQVAEQVRDFLLTGEIRNAVNFPSMTADMVKVLRPFMNLCSKLGTFQGQVHRMDGTTIKKISVRYSGNVCAYDTRVLTLCLLKSFFEPFLGETVNYVNARHMAESRHIIVEESTSPQVSDFANEITLTVETDKKGHVLSGAMFGEDNYRFVRFEDFFLEVVPQDTLLIVHNYDRPGVVGRVGTLLGQHRINISRMQVALEQNFTGDVQKRQAVAIINIDQSTPEHVLKELRSFENIIAVYQVVLGRE